MLNGGEAVPLPIDLSFLGKGKWTAKVIGDDSGGPATFKLGDKTVTARDRIGIPMSPHGGLVVWITR